MATRKKKRKATPAQLRALAKGRAVMKKRRAQKRKAPKRKKVSRRRNPAYGNYQKARAVVRGSRRANPVRKLAPCYVVKSKDGKYFDGAGFTSNVRKAARYVDLQHTTSIARRLADATGKSVRIFDLRK